MQSEKSGEHDHGRTITPSPDHVQHSTKKGVRMDDIIILEPKRIIGVDNPMLTNGLDNPAIVNGFDNGDQESEDEKVGRFYPVGNYMFKVNGRNTRAKCEVCSKLTKKTLERRHWRRSGVFIVNFEQNSYLFLVFLLLTLSK